MRGLDVTAKGVCTSIDGDRSVYSKERTRLPGRGFVPRQYIINNTGR